MPVQLWSGQVVTDVKLSDAEVGIRGLYQKGGCSNRPLLIKREGAGFLGGASAGQLIARQDA